MMPFGVDGGFHCTLSEVELVLNALTTVGGEGAAEKYQQ